MVELRDVAPSAGMGKTCHSNAVDDHVFVSKTRPIQLTETFCKHMVVQATLTFTLIDKAGGHLHSFHWNDLSATELSTNL